MSGDAAADVGSSDADGAVVWAARVTGVGDLATSFFDEGMVVLFGDDAPEELQDVAVVHTVTHALADGDGVRPGDVARLGEVQLSVLAVGPVANDNLRSLGHLVLKRNGETEAALPGDVCCDTGPIPALTAGDPMVVTRPDEEVAP